MQCRVCQKETQEGASSCPNCGTPLNSKPPNRPARNRRRDPQAPVSPETEARHRFARTAYRVAILGLIPGLGLILGPIAVVLGIVARRRALKDPEFTLWGPVFGAIIGGSIIALCNGVGVTLMVLGLRSAGLL